MMEGRGVLKCFWAEAVATTVYLLNISPTKAVFNRTPYEAWRGNTPKVSHLRVFGCIAYALVNSQARCKLDEKCEKCIFVGYSSQSKAYKLYNPVSGKIMVNRNVVFNEDAAGTLIQKMKVQIFNCCLLTLLLIKSMEQISFWQVHRLPHQLHQQHLQHWKNLQLRQLH